MSKMARECKVFLICHKMSNVKNLKQNFMYELDNKCKFTQ